MFGCSNWASLPGDVWFSIGLKLDDAADRIRFRAVSKSFRSHLPYRQPPWLMLSESHDHDETPPRRRFVIVGGQRYYKFDLPQAHLARCLGSTNNWVITMKTDIIVRLLNPFSKAEIHLPDGLSFGEPYFEAKPSPAEEIYRRDTFLKKVIVCPRNGSGTDFLVIAILNRGGKLAMARPGDSFWTNIKTTEIKEHNGTADLCVYRGRLYVVNSRGFLLSCDITNYAHHPNTPPQLSVASEKFDHFKICPVDGVNMDVMLYLVEWSGHLLLVIRFIDHFRDIRLEELPFYKTVRFQIYKFNFTNRKWIEIKSLGKYSLFLGLNTSVSVLASDYFGLVKKNCIYFTDDYAVGYRQSNTPGGHDMGVYDLDDDSIRPHYNGISTSYYSPPIWIVPD